MRHKMVVLVLGYALVETYLCVFVNSPYQFETTRYLFMCFCYQFELGNQEKDGFLFRIQLGTFLLMVNMILAWPTYT